MQARNITALAMVLALPAVLAGQPVLTLDLESAVSRALQYNASLAQRAAAEQAGRFRQRAAAAQFLPQLTPEARVEAGDGSETWQYGAELSQRLPLGTEWRAEARIRGDENDEDRSGDGQRRTVVQLELRQPLFREFGSLMQTESLRQAGYAIRTARRRRLQARADLALDVVRTYGNCRLLERQLGAEEASAESLEDLLRLTRARAAQGRGTRSEVLRAELDRGEARGRVAEYRERLSTARLQLADLVGLADGHEVRLAPLPSLQGDLPDLKEAVEIAFENRIELEQMRDDLQHTRDEVARARRGLWPAVDLVTRYEQIGRGDSATDAWAADSGEWFVGLAADAPLNIVGARAELGAARARVDGNRAALQTVERTVTRSVQKSLSDCRRVRAEAVLARRTLTLAERRRRLAHRLYELGRGDQRDTADAETALIRARTRLAALETATMVSDYALRHALGTLVAAPSAEGGLGEQP